MNDSKYLYDLDISQLANVPYQDVLLLKLNSAKKLMNKLVHIENMQDNDRMRKVHKAIGFNRTLLKELGFDDLRINSELKKTWRKNLNGKHGKSSMSI